MGSEMCIRDRVREIKHRSIDEGLSLSAFVGRVVSDYLEEKR